MKIAKTEEVNQVYKTYLAYMKQSLGISNGIMEDIGIAIVRMIVNPLREIEALMLEVENGDLTVEGAYHSKDEIGVLTNSFDSMMFKLRELMGQVNNTSDQVAAASGTQNVAVSTEEISASAASLSHVAVELQEQIEVFKV